MQVVLQHLSSPDYARLRQVSRTVNKRTTRHIPCITLRLSFTSDKYQLQQWRQATQSLQHAPMFQVTLEGIIEAEVFEAAVQMLVTAHQFYNSPAAGCQCCYLVQVQAPQMG